MARILMNSLTVCALLLGAPVAFACSKVMKVALEQWPPYIYVDQKKQAAGVDVELLKAIFAEAHCSLLFEEELPRKRRLAVFLSGGIDLMLAASDTPDRREYAWFSKPYRNESVSLFTRPEKINQYSDLDGFAAILARKVTVLSPNAGWYGEDYKNYLARLTAANLISPFETTEQGMKMFAVARAELIMGDAGAITYEAKLQGLQVVALPLAIVDAPVHLMFSKKSVKDSDVATINQAIDRLERRGALAKIRSKYGLN
jgi:polar amino acid transport system substrate-binding protein